MAKLTDRSTIAAGEIDNALLIHVVDTTPSNASYKVALGSLGSVFYLNLGLGTGSRMARWFTDDYISSSDARETSAGKFGFGVDASSTIKMKIEGATADSRTLYIDHKYTGSSTTYPLYVNNQAVSTGTGSRYLAYLYDPANTSASTSLIKYGTWVTVSGGGSQHIAGRFNADGTSGIPTVFNSHDIGVLGTGGISNREGIGLAGYATGNSNFDRYGVYGHAAKGGSGTGAIYGVYGVADALDTGSGDIVIGVGGYLQDAKHGTQNYAVSGKLNEAGDWNNPVHTGHFQAVVGTTGNAAAHSVYGVHGEAKHDDGTSTGSMFGGYFAASVNKASEVKTNPYYALYTDGVDTTASGVVIPNAYSLYVAANNKTASGTITNSWGVYQAGANDVNHFEGNILAQKQVAGGVHASDCASGTTVTVNGANGMFHFCDLATLTGNGTLSLLNIEEGTTHFLRVVCDGVTDFDPTVGTGTANYYIPSRTFDFTAVANNDIVLVTISLENGSYTISINEGDFHNPTA